MACEKCDEERDRALRQQKAIELYTILTAEKIRDNKEKYPLAFNEIHFLEGTVREAIGWAIDAVNSGRVKPDDIDEAILADAVEAELKCRMDARRSEEHHRTYALAAQAAGFKGW